jgi:dipeptidyl aminopeptidase/acylaminoacyl peptidase
MKPLLGLAATLLLVAGSAPAAEKRPMQVEDLFKFKRVAAPQISPDGKQVVYQVTTVSLEENKSTTALWIAATDGKTPPKALTDPKGKKDTGPRWSGDGNAIVFESTRSGASQLWAVDPHGGEPVQLTDLSTGASNPIWSPDLKRIAFVSAVYPEFSEKPFAESDKLNKEKEDAIEKNPVKAKVFTKLFYRHWVEYVDDKRQHLFVGEFGLEGGKPKLSSIRDVTPGDRDAYPTSTTFSSGDDFTFTPDSKHLVFTAVPEKNEAWSTNYDLCRVSIGNTSTKWESLTPNNPAADSGPKFSPDGKKLAWRVQKKAGYEADKWDVVVAECKPDGTLGVTVNCSELGKSSCNEFAWRGSDQLAFTADSEARTFINYVAPRAKGDISQEPLDFGSASSLSYTSDGKQGVFLHTSLRAPGDVWAMSTVEGRTTEAKVSNFNDALLAELDIPKPESVKVKIEDGTMQMWILKPPGFDAKKKWPVAYLVHGGPQGAWEDSWSFRWNAQAWAAQGYVVAMPNPRGSTGFGQKFVDEITGDWGGKCYRDLVAGLDYVEKLPYVDKDRIASAGGSFGGYMQNWFAVSDIAPRFKCLITHCSVWNFESMWGTTDELWFDEWEHGGLPWEKPKKYAEFSPHKKAGNMAKHKVPMLIIHNDLDFRCPIGQGHELFSALQRQGVPSRFVNFPDEGHWVLKPKNSQRWHQEVFGWLKKYCPPGGK